MHLKKYGNGNLVLSTVGFLLNTIILVKLVKKTNKKPAQIFLINLCIADIFISTFAFLSGISPFIHASLMAPDTASYFFLVFTTGILFSFSASLPTCWTITFDRLFAILRPLRHATYYTPRRTKQHIAITWVYATVTTTIAITGGSILNSLMVVRYVLAPSLLITIILLAISYTLIIKAILRNNKKMAGLKCGGKSAANDSRARTNKKIYIHSLIIILNFTICSSPYVVFSILHSPVEHNSQPLFMAVGTMGLTAIPVFDSLSYFFLNLIIRKRQENQQMVMRNIALR